MLALTQEEKQVIVFVALLAICGLGISFLSKRFAPGPISTPQTRKH